MRKFVLSIFAVLLLGLSGHAQNRQVTGTVTDETGSPVPGATVMLQGSQSGAITRENGGYSIQAPANGTLVFSFIGYENAIVPVEGRTIVDVVLRTSSLAIDNVVVTAMGVSRAEKTLGYSAVTVNADDLTLGKSASVMDGLMGKVAGLNISNSGGAGTSQKVIIRGYSSLNSNQPLYVVDGMPMSNNLAGVQDLNNAVDFGNQANQINPNDIQNITVLKGASATALYGSRAANGVIMITTTRGRKNQDVTITYDGSFMGTDVLRIPQTQQMFGQGWYYPYYSWYGSVMPGNFDFSKYSDYLGGWSAGENGSWGPKLNGRLHEWNIGAWAAGQGDLLKKPFSYAKNSLRHFYEQGFEANNSLSVSGGNETGSFIVSYANSYSNGVLPGAGDFFKRNNFSVRGQSDIKQGFAQLSYSINYIRSDQKSPMAGQGGKGSTIYGDIIQYPVDIDYADLKDYNSIYNGADSYYTPYAQNPFWVNDNNIAINQEDKVYGSFELTVPLIKGLSALGRVSGEFSDARMKLQNAIWNYSPNSWNGILGEAAPEVGYYEENNTHRGQIDANVMLKADYMLNKDFNLNAFVGWNLNQRDMYNTKSYVDGLGVPGWYSLDNSGSEVTTTSRIEKRRLIGLFSQAELNFRNYAYLTLTARNDSSSTLPIDANSFFYWGSNLAVILTDAFPSIQSKTLSFAKVRLAAGQTGNDADPYLTGNPTYRRTSPTFPFGQINFPINNVSGSTRYPFLPATILKPEITTEYEAGFDVRLFDHRLSIDASFYSKSTKDQILDVNMAPESSWMTTTVNVGEVQNRGIELAVGVTPVRRPDGVTWDMTYTFAKNWSKLVSLYDQDGVPVTRLPIYSLGGTPSFDVIVGQPIGVFTYNDVQRVKEGEHAGKMIVNNNTGFPTIDAASRTIVGKSAPDFTMGLQNRLSYKNLSMGFTLDWRKGGMMVSQTASTSYFVGNAPETAYNERNSFVLPNSVRNTGTAASPVYVENNIPVDIYAGGMNYYWYSQMNQSQTANTNLVSKSYLKLREINLSYTLPRKWFANSGISTMRVSLVGRNLLMWTKSQGFIDPDITNYGNDLDSEYGEYYAAPSQRTFGASLNLVF
jgi:TonB-linked SusC/RagA family outer membrane protein